MQTMSFLCASRERGRRGRRLGLPRLADERRERRQRVQAHLAAREDAFVRRFLLEMLADAEERFEIDPLATEAGRRAVSAAVGALRDEHRVARAEAVLLDQGLHVLGEARTAIHCLHREVTSGELALALR